MSENHSSLDVTRGLVEKTSFWTGGPEAWFSINIEWWFLGRPRLGASRFFRSFLDGLGLRRMADVKGGDGANTCDGNLKSGSKIRFIPAWLAVVPSLLG